MSTPSAANPAEAGLLLFQEWVGAHYARSTRVESSEVHDSLLQATFAIGRHHRLGVVLLDTIASQSSPEFERARAIVEQRLNDEGLQVVLWVPRGAPMPVDEPGLSDLVVAIREARELEDGRHEVRRPVNLYLRRSGTEGSVVTAIGGLASRWAVFTNRVPGSFQLNSNELYRLPFAEEEKEALYERIINEAGQPTIDEGVTIPAEDAWTANFPSRGQSFVLGAPDPETDATGPHLRRHVRQMLKQIPPREEGVDARALVLLGLSTYAEEEKLSWLIRGVDPSLYAGFEIVGVIADGEVKTLLEPQRGELPWDAPLT